LLQPDDTILDLCGGHGRHSLELCARGFTGCTLLDYSTCLIEKARSTAAANQYPLTAIESDARSTALPSDSFDHIFIMGNSLGYIMDPTGDREIFIEARRLLKKRGRLLVDVADGNAVRSGFRPNAWHQIGSEFIVCRERELNGDMVSAREVVLSKSDGLLRDETYAIRLFDADSLTSLLRESGFSVDAVHENGIEGKPDEDLGFMNNRLVVTASKS
jgi:D-alanine-D-alanine ligase